MATSLYAAGRNGFLTGAIHYLTDNVCATMVHSSGLTGNSYYPDLANDAFYSIIPTGAIVGVPVSLANKTAVAGVAGCSNIIFPPPQSIQVDALVVWVNTNNPATSQLIAFIDRNFCDELPFTPNGVSPVTFTIDPGVNHLFKL